MQMNFITLLCRYSLVLIGIWIFLQPQFFDSLFSLVWKELGKQRIVQNALFEPFVAIYSFLASMIFFVAIEFFQFGKERKFTKETIHCTTFQCQASPTVYILGVKILFLLFGKPIVDKELFYLPVQTFRILGEVFFGLICYDIIFYFIHKAMHNHKFLWKIHSQHHSQKKMCSRAIVNHGFIDGSLQVFTNIFVQNISPIQIGFGKKHPFSRIIHNIIVTFWLTSSHSGFDLPFMLHRIFPRIFGGSKNHEKHHRYSNCCYEQFFRFFDKFDPKETKKIEVNINEEKKTKYCSSLKKTIKDYVFWIIINHIGFLLLIYLF